jgi:hypothetical protein
MTAVPSSWLVGTITLTSSETIVVDGVNNAVIPAGTYYYYDATASLSLFDEILAAVTPHMTTPAIFVGQDRKLRVTAGASFTWTIPAALQGALGFGASIPSTTSATATDVSELLWSPGWPATTIGHPADTTGWKRSERVHLGSASGLTQDTTIHGTAAVFTGLSWAFVLRERAWAEGSDTGEPGDYKRFFDQVLDPGHRWKRYKVLAEDEASSSAVVWPVGFGPYKARDLDNEFWSRSIPTVDRFTDIRLDGMVTAEIS